jgi:hypothetical protein
MYVCMYVCMYVYMSVCIYTTGTPRVRFENIYTHKAPGKAKGVSVNKTNNLRTNNLQLFILFMPTPFAKK